MKKTLIGIVLSICVSCISFAQSFNIDAGVAMDYSDGYDGVVFGGTVDFDYVLPTNVVIFSNTDFAFGSDLPKVAISEILGAGYRFTISEKFYFQVGGGLGFVFLIMGMIQILIHIQKEKHLYIVKQVLLLLQNSELNLLI